MALPSPNVLLSRERARKIVSLPTASMGLLPKPVNGELDKMKPLVAEGKQCIEGWALAYVFRALLRPMEGM